MQMISAFWALKVCFKIVLDGKKSDPNLYIKHKILCLLVGTNSSSRVDCVSLTPPSQAHSINFIFTRGHFVSSISFLQFDIHSMRNV